jgi:hypothetical protein
MLEGVMSVWPKPAEPGPSLSTSEGSLILVSIDVQAQFLESLLEALAHVSFPINPEIYHDAVMVYLYPGWREEEAVTLVEFPAYAAHLNEVRRALESYGFDPGSVYAAGMLDAIHSQGDPEPAPEGAEYISRYRRRHRAAAAR